MRSFDYNETNLSELGSKSQQLLDKINKNSGKLELIENLNSDLIADLENTSIINEAYYSTKIEGIEIPFDRLKYMVENPQKIQAENDFEKQALGYAMFIKALNQKLEAFKVDTTSMLAMYQILFNVSAADTKTLYRRHDCQKVLVDDEVKEVQVSPIKAFESPLYTGSAVTALAEATTTNPLANLINIAKFNVDIMCIRPFDAGVGRIARLFSYLVLLKTGWNIVRITSLSKVFESDASQYYNALNLCSKNWEKNKNTYEPFIELFLDAVNKAYEQIIEDVGPISGSKTVVKKTRNSNAKKPKQNKQARIKEFFENNNGAYSKSDILHQMPDISMSTVENTLRDLCAENFIEKLGAGRATKYKLKKQPVT